MRLDIQTLKAEMDADRLAAVRRDAERLRTLYIADFDEFLRFLDVLSADWQYLRNAAFT